MRQWWRRNRISEDTLAEADNDDPQSNVLWWERLITIALWSFVIAFLLATFVAVIIPDFFPLWFGVQAVEVTDPNVRQYIPQKTLWDWFGLIAIPLAIVVVGYMLNRADRAHERRLQDQRIKESREIEEKRLVENQKLEEKRLEDTRQIEQERTQDAIVKDYFDQMTELLLHHQLRESSKSAEVRSVARARTLTALRGVDGERKGMIIQFLYESGLIGYVDEDGFECISEIVDLSGADLSKIYLTGVQLSGANLVGVKFSEAILNGANLLGIKLFGVNLTKASLIDACLEDAKVAWTCFIRGNFTRADLTGANFCGAKLIEANLANVCLYDAIFDRANLTDCIGLTLDQLLQAQSLHGTILPDYIDPADLGDKWSPPPEEEITPNSYTPIP